MPPFVHGFTKAIPPLPTGATDNSQLAPAGSNQTGFLDVSGFNLPAQGDVATITYRVTVDAGVPTGTVISNLVTATSGTVSDTDLEDVTVGGVVPTPPTPPAPGPSSGPTPPPLGPRVFVPTDDVAGPSIVEDAGISLQNWVLIASAIVAAAIATFVTAVKSDRRRAKRDTAPSGEQGARTSPGPFRFARLCRLAYLDRNPGWTITTYSFADSHDFNSDFDEVVTTHLSSRTLTLPFCRPTRARR
jgi:hypothetical protein